MSDHNLPGVGIRLGIDVQLVVDLFLVSLAGVGLVPGLRLVIVVAAHRCGRVVPLRSGQTGFNRGSNNIVVESRSGQQGEEDVLHGCVWTSGRYQRSRRRDLLRSLEHRGILRATGGEPFSYMLAEPPGIWSRRGAFAWRAHRPGILGNRPIRCSFLDGMFSNMGDQASKPSDQASEAPLLHKPCHTGSRKLAAGVGYYRQYRRASNEVVYSIVAETILPGNEIDQDYIRASLVQV